jgi:hypothetical protein
MAVVRLKLAKRLTWTDVSGSMTPSLKAAKAVTSLMVEHGTNPLFRASFWLTMLRTRPLDGSTATTAPFKVPSASTAARRTVRSSASTLSPSVGSTGGAGLYCVTCLAGVFLTGAILTGCFLGGAATFRADAGLAAGFWARFIFGAVRLAGIFVLGGFFWRALAPVGIAAVAPAIWSKPTRTSKTGNRIFILRRTLHPALAGRVHF